MDNDEGPRDVLIDVSYISTIYLQSSGVIYNIKYYCKSITYIYLEYSNNFY